MYYTLGTKLRIRGHEGRVKGCIEYRNPQDGNKSWREYRIIGNGKEFWLSVDEIYREYSISWPANDVKGNIGPEWQKVDEGVQVVKSFEGDVDVDPGEKATFVEYEDETKEKILSVEIWEDGTEYSKGEYIEMSEIEVLEVPKKPSIDFKNKILPKIMVVIFAIIFILPFLFDLISCIPVTKSINDYLKNSTFYDYQTSITGNENQNADVYCYFTDATTDDVAKDIIDGIEGMTESVTQRDDMTDAEIAIVTKNEYCLIYHPDESAENESSTQDIKNKVYVQVSDRKYNYTSNNAPYRSSPRVTNWYRAHYYGSAFTKDVSSFKSVPSAYTMYDGDTVHNIGNGYFDNYAKSAKQAAINSRDSDSGGVSSGK